MLGWDDVVPEEYLLRWKAWVQDLAMIEQIQVKRCLVPKYFGEITSKQIHIFSDASSLGYGSAAYLRLRNSHGNTHVVFLMGKARLAPLKLTTIPRLELTAATVSVRIGQLLLNELEMKVDNVIYHTDSTTVLHFIRNESKRYPIFVANRVQLIRNFTEVRQWRYVNTKDNPADYASRGIDMKVPVQLSAWLNGPQFLMEAEDTWPSQPQSLDVSSTEILSAAVTIDISLTTTNRLIEYYSDWYRLKRAVAIYLKFFKLLKQKSQGHAKVSNTSLELSDLQKAEFSIVRFIQHQAFQDELNSLENMSNPTPSDETHRHRSKQVNKRSHIYRLNPFVKDGVLRVGGRLGNMQIENSTKHPILLPQKHHVTSPILRSIHHKLGHAVKNHVLAEARSVYWVIHGGAAVRSMISRCVICRKLRSPCTDQKMSNLPYTRVNTEPPFTYTGVDYFGPFSIKEGRKELKRYGAMFTCMSSRAIHIEVAKSLDTDSFINSLRRFIARRGVVRQIISDNGTNFIGAERELRQALSDMDENHIKSYLLKHSISWTFNPPTASHMGGAWELQIRAVRKFLSGLSKEFGTQLDEDSFHTLMCEVEGVNNSRPLTTIPGEVDDMEPLTPSHILMTKSTVILPPPGDFQRPDIYMRKRWRRVQYIANVFWKRWQREYILTLQHHQKWNKQKRNMKKGDIVLISDDSLPRNSWRLGRVIELEPDNKGNVRSVQIKVSNTQIRRPIHKLVLLLPVEEH